MWAAPTAVRCPGTPSLSGQPPALASSCPRSLSPPPRHPGDSPLGMEGAVHASCHVPRFSGPERAALQGSRGSQAGGRGCPPLPSPACGPKPWPERIGSNAAWSPGPLRVFLKNVTRTAGRGPELGFGCGQISCWDPQAFRQGGLLRTEWCWQSNPAACWWTLGVGAGFEPPCQPSFRG